MNKQEFIKNVSDLKRSKGYGENWDRIRYEESGFNECKEKVAVLALQLDEQGLTIEAYNLFRQQTIDLTAAYTELLNTQSELFKARKEIAFLQQRNKELEQRLNDIYTGDSKQ